MLSIHVQACFAEHRMSSDFSRPEAGVFQGASPIAVLFVKEYTPGSPHFMKIGERGVRISECSAIFSREEHRGFWLLLRFALVAIIAWRVGTASPVPRHAKTKVNLQDGLTYIWIPPGTFQMGCSADDSACTDNERPAYSVTLTKGFWIGQTPVTQAAYKKVVGSNPSTFKGDLLPVEQVSWDDAKAYCEVPG